MNRWRIFIFAILLPLTGCVHFIAPYDATLDATMTQVQQDTELFLTHLQDAKDTDPGTYVASRDFYLRTEPTLRTLLTRAQSVSRGEAVADQVANILATVERMQATHLRDGTLSPAAITLERAAFESQFRSFFTLEFALRGRKTGASATPTAPAIPISTRGGTT